MVSGRVATSSHVSVKLAISPDISQTIVNGRINIRIKDLELRKETFVISISQRTLMRANHMKGIIYSADLPTRIDLLGAALPAGAPLAVGLALHQRACCSGAYCWEEGVML
jgi:hypothetical protein